MTMVGNSNLDDVEPSLEAPESESGREKEHLDQLSGANQNLGDSLEDIKDATTSKDEDDMIVTNETGVKKGHVSKDSGQVLRMVSLGQDDPRPCMKEERVKHDKQACDLRSINDELRQNYENEISVLRKQLQNIGPQGSPSEEVLLKRCHMLETQLRKSQNDAESLAEQVSGLKTQLQIWPNRVRELEDENETLRNRVEDLRVINQQRHSETDELQEIIKNLEAKLWEQSSEKSHQEKVFMQRLMVEYDNLLKEYELLKRNNANSERNTYESRSKISELTSKLSESENDFKKVESENNFLRDKLRSERSYSSSSHGGAIRGQLYTGFGSGDYFIDGSSQELTRSQSSYKPNNETSMMTMSCYGALPSYGLSRDNDDSGYNKQNYNKQKGAERYTLNEMSQSLYVASQSESELVTTPTNDRRTIPTLENVRYGKGCANNMEVDLMTESMNRHSKDHEASFRNSNKRQKPSVYQRGSWAESKTEEDKDLERHYDQLQNQKRQLMTNLSHIPTNSCARNRRTNRESRESLEAQLDLIDRQLGLIRMTLKQKNILK